MSKNRKIKNRFLQNFPSTKWKLQLAFLFFALFSSSPLISVPVQNFSFVTVSSDTISIQWDNQFNNYYQTTFSTIPGFQINIASGITEQNQNTTSYLNLIPNTSHTFLVKISTDDDSNYLSLSTYTLSKSPGFSGFKIFTTSMTVYLTNNGNPAGSTTTYRVRISTDGFSSIAFSSQGVNETGESAPALAVSGLQANSTYEIRIDALNFVNAASSMTVVTTTSTLAQIPGSFSEFTPFNVGISSLTVSWNPNGNPLTPPTSYQVQISTDIGFGVYSTSETFLTTVTTTTLTGNTSYYFRVMAYGRGGDQIGFNAPIATFTRSASPGYSGFQMFTTSVTVYLVNNGNPAGSTTTYRIQFSTDGFNSIAFSSQGVNEPNYAAPTLTVFGLQANSTYQIGIDALNYTGVISTRTIVASTATYAALPGSFNTIALTDVWASSITLSWNPNGNPLTPPTSYQVQISTAIDFGASSSSETFLTTVTTTTLISNTSYYFRVKTFNRSGGWSDYNQWVATFTRANTLQNLVSTGQTVSTIVLSWTSGNSSLTRVEISSSADNFQNTISTPVSFSDNFTSTVAIFTNLRESTSYFFRLRALGENNLPSNFSVILNTKTATIPPAAIINMAADTGGGANEDGMIRLGWNAPADDLGAGGNVSGYLVRYATFGVTTANFDSPLVSTFTQSWVPRAAGNYENTPERLITGLNPGTTYYFAVKSSDSVGNLSSWSSANNINSSAPAQDLPLSAPTNPVFVSISSKSVELSWTVPSAPTYVDDRNSYKVYYATYDFSASSHPYVIQSTGTVHPLSNVTVTGLSNETTYYFKVTAVDKGDQGNGFYSIVLEGNLSASTRTVTLDRIEPSPISNLTAITGPNEGEIILQWTAPGDDGTDKNLISGSYYEIKYSSSGIIMNSNYSSPPDPFYVKTISTQTVPNSDQGVSITGLLTAATYWFAIKTKDESGNISVWNSSHDITTVNLFASTVSQRDNIAPNNVTGLILTAGYKKINLSWIGPGDNGLTGNVTGYFKIKYGSSNITNDTEFDAALATITISTIAVSGTRHGIDVTGLSNDITYYFAVKTIDDYGNISTFSATEVKNDYPRNQAPGAFSLNLPSDSSVTITSPITLSWNASVDSNQAEGDTVTYIVQYSTDSNFTFPFVSSAPAGISVSTAISQSLIENSSIAWRVRAQDNDGYTTFSNTRRLWINFVNSQPSTFTLLSPVISSITAVLTPTLYWQDSFDLDPGDTVTYILQYSSKQIDALGGITVTGITTTHYTITTNLTEDVTYYWKVTAVSTSPLTGTDHLLSNDTFYFFTNSVPSSPNTFSLISPTADERLTTLTPMLSWQTAGDVDPGNTVYYTLTVENAVNSLYFSTMIANLTVTTYTLTSPLTENRPYIWSVSAKSSPDNLTRIATPVFGRLMKADVTKALPLAVTLSSPTLESIVHTSSPTLSWTTTTDPDNELDYSSMDKVKYIIKIGEKADYSDALGKQAFFSDGSGFLPQKSNFTLKDQTRYYWQVGVAGFQPVGINGNYVNTDTSTVTGGIEGCVRVEGVPDGIVDLDCYRLSDQKTFTVSLVNTSPSNPGLVSPSNNTTLGVNRPLFEWAGSTETDPGQTIDYVLQVSTLPDFSVSIASISDIVFTSYTLTDPLLQNRLYYWRVLSQDKLSDGRKAGDAISSPIYNFILPVLNTPKEPTGIKGTLSADKTSFVMTWNAVTQNTDGSSIVDLAGYNVYRSRTTSGLGTGTPFVQVSSNTAAYADTSVAGLEYYYAIRTINNSYLLTDSSGTISINSNAAKSSTDTSLLVVPNEPALEGKIEVQIPEEVKAVLNSVSNSYGEDLKVNLGLTAAPGLKDALFGIEIKIKTANSDRTLTNFTFEKPIKISFPFAKILSPKFAAPGTPLAAIPASAEEVGVFWNNGVEWVNLGGAPDYAGNSVFVRTRNVGEFAVRRVTKATEFEIFSITPNKIFTPNGDGCNDFVAFQFQNPKGFSGIKGKIFDLSGSYISDIKPTSSLGTVSFNAGCPKPNLADDTLVWDGRNSEGNMERKGIYIYQIEAEGKAYNGTIVIAR